MSERSHTTSPLRPHGLMFHYFHDEIRHPRGQGTISGMQFERMIDHAESTGRVLPAEDWVHGVEKGGLRTGDVCVTFDDTLRSQFDVALPVLKRRGLTALWFVQSGVLIGAAATLEAFRQFRNSHFASVADFYTSFYAMAKRVCSAASMNRLSEPMQSGYLQEFAFYTAEDRRFRYVRDRVLHSEEYFDVMMALVEASGTSIEKLSSGQLLDRECLCELDRTGHIIGLHSHTHPTNLADLTEDEQRSEYRMNFDVLSEMLAKSPFTVAHPSNSYSPVTLAILRGLGIRIGFRSNMAMPVHSSLEYPRMDCADLLEGKGF